MSTSLDDADFDVDPEAPEGYRSTAAKGPYIAVISVASVAFLIAQFVLPQLVMLTMMPGFAGGGMMFAIEEPQVDRAAVWQDQIWLPVKKLGTAPNPQVALKAVTFAGEWVQDSDLPLSFSPEFLLADGERLWCVATGHVAIVEGRNVNTSYPARGLNNPSNPYLQEGRLRIVDQDASGNWLVLEFHEGEWTAVARVMTPVATPPPNGQTGFVLQAPRLQVLTTGNRLQALLSDTTTSWFAEVLPEGGLDEPASEEPVSALTALETFEAVWTPCDFPGPVLFLSLDNRPAVLERQNTPFSSGRTAYWLEAGKRITIDTLRNQLNEHEGVVTDETGRVFVLLDSFPPGDVKVTELTAGGFLSTDGAKQPSLFTGIFGELSRMYAVIMAIPCLLLIVYLAVLHVAMRYSRNPRYGFAHRTVRLASIGRRALARFIDTLLMVLPLLFGLLWWYLAFDLEQFVQQLQTNPQQQIVAILLTVFGALTYMVMLVILFGTLEGVCGWSPGKLLCGLRVIRTTLEPVGVLRGLIRQFLIIIDSQFNYLIGAAMIAALPKQQRLGDLAADSIVVEAASLRDETSTFER